MRKQTKLSRHGCFDYNLTIICHHFQELAEDTRERQRSKLVPGKLPAKTASIFGPLVPQERPIYLPGGRRWKTPKDAFNDEFIKEVISSQAELIVGSTLG